MPTATDSPDSRAERVDPQPSTPSGRALAIAFDCELRQQELAERQQRLREMRHESAIEATANAARGEDLGEATHRERRLEAENHLLHEFHTAVTNSMSWRFLQFVRGMLGRRW